MKITLESTEQIVQLNGVPARVWSGSTEGGVPIFAFITRLAVQEGHDAGELERGLRETARPTEPPVWPARMIL